MSARGFVVVLLSLLSVGCLEPDDPRRVATYRFTDVRLLTDSGTTRLLQCIDVHAVRNSNGLSSCMKPNGTQIIFRDADVRP